MIVARLIPHEELVRRVEVEREKRLAKIPEPIVVNADALVGLLQVREFQLGGVGYRAPPLSGWDGVRLLVAVNALKDLRTAGASDTEMVPAVRCARHLIRRAIRPIRWWRWFSWKPLRRLDHEQLEMLGNGLLFVPDATPSFVPTRAVTIDMLDELAGFARAYPAWVGADGMPKHWALYIYGLRHLGRERHRLDLRFARAMRASQATAKDYERWELEYRVAAGWT